MTRSTGMAREKATKTRQAMTCRTTRPPWAPPRRSTLSTRSVENWMFCLGRDRRAWLARTHERVLIEELPQRAFVGGGGALVVGGGASGRLRVPLDQVG